MTKPAAKSSFKQFYERLRPMIVWLGLAELVWIAFWLLAAQGVNTGFRAVVATWIAVMLGWLVLVIILGTRDFFLAHTRWLSNLIGVGLVVALSTVWFTATPVAWEGLKSAAAGTTDQQLVAIHILRLLAIGTVIKFFQKQLPLHFVILGSLPDFVFAISAVVVTIMAAGAPLAPIFLVTWHIVGCLLFLGAGLSMFFTVPSPLRMFHTKPDTSIVFQFPMVLAPNFTVALFMLAHLFALVKLVS